MTDNNLDYDSVLKSKAMACSEGDDWNSIKLQWKFIRFYYKAGGVCACGRCPIAYHYVLFNSVTKRELVICTKCGSLFGQDMKRLIFSIIRICYQNIIGVDPSHSFYPSFAELLFYMGILSESDCDDYIRICNDSTLSSSVRRSYFERINLYVIAALYVDRPFCDCLIPACLKATYGPSGILESLKFQCDSCGFVKDFVEHPDCTFIDS